jgi:hypothetical protein
MIGSKSKRRPVVREAVLSAGAVVVLLTALVAMDERVRRVFTLGPNGRPSDEVVEAGGRARELVTLLIDVVRDQSLGHAPLMLFVLAASVLVFFMLRT